MEFGIFNLMGSRDQPSRPHKPLPRSPSRPSSPTNSAMRLPYPERGCFGILHSTFQLRELVVTQKASLLF